jgi:hypothetical protein
LLRPFIPLGLALAGTILLYLLRAKAGLLVHEVTSMLPPPPPPILLGKVPVQEPEVLPDVLVFLVGAVYLAWHFWPRRKTAVVSLWPFGIALVVSISLWAFYSFFLTSKLVWDYEGEKYTVGLYYTEHGKEFAKDHTHEQIIRKHPGTLATVFDEESIAWSKAILQGTYMAVVVAFAITLILMMDLLVGMIWPKSRQH